MRVLVACEYSGTVRDAFLVRGHDAMSCDLLPTDAPGPHYQGDVRDVLDDGWDLVLHGLPPLVPTVADVAAEKAATMALPERERSKVHYASPGPDRWKLRSVTYAGIAAAMADQWGSL